MITSLDHIVLSVRDLDATCRFYVDVLGMELRMFGEGRPALHFGDQKINLHEVGADIEPRAQAPTPGSADICLLTDVPLKLVVERLRRGDVAVELGPVGRTGARGKIESVYVRDPDGNLVELSNLG